MISTIREGERMGVAAGTSKEALPPVPNPRSL